ncbi:MAG: hypothetical protein RR386_02335 [Bacteroidaceae bacterium]
MDYKYIEQLLERYWQCETSVAEERILRNFFCQEEVPAHLAKYKDLFLYEQNEATLCLGPDFEERVLQQIQEPKLIQARPLTLAYRLRPLYKAAAVVAIVFTLGTAAQRSFTNEAPSNNGNYDYSAYKDTYSDPQVAYEHASSALQLVSDLLRTELNDTLSSTPNPEKAK